MGPEELGPCTWVGLMGLDQSCHWVPESSGSLGYRNTEVFEIDWALGFSRDWGPGRGDHSRAERWPERSGESLKLSVIRS